MAVRPIDASELMAEIYACSWDSEQDKERAEDLVLGTPTLTLPNEWVNVEDRLPEESDGMVLFTNGKAVTSGYRNHMFRMSGEEGVYAPAIRKGDGYMRVTHWMYLPAPPDRRPPEGNA